MPVYAYPRNEFGPHIMIDTFLLELDRVLSDPAALRAAKDRSGGTIVVNYCGQPRNPTIELPPKGNLELSTKGRGSLRITNTDRAQRRALSKQDIIDVARWALLPDGGVRRVLGVMPRQPSALPRHALQPTVMGVQARVPTYVCYGGTIVFDNAPWLKFDFAPTPVLCGEGYLG
ncbi:hypothetical protein FA10DRAFT_268914 [Acaromyces ingoldii]|uniref:Uncharacterized protein n=1 Tax=Acaromyces ingoldii TaxID=215250 RepID=A0A316YGV1_9BASI|nr:hypothetical protein FA10DRAFT_268914 [Acaromyces ingoldii]PWN88770.1 hypothetical protein FA10DRAFT_268914 [Acaromyces ingoldii]